MIKVEIARRVNMLHLPDLAGHAKRAASTSAVIGELEEAFLRACPSFEAPLLRLREDHKLFGADLQTELTEILDKLGFHLGSVARTDPYPRNRAGVEGGRAGARGWRRAAEMGGHAFPHDVIAEFDQSARAQDGRSAAAPRDLHSDLVE